MLTGKVATPGAIFLFLGFAFLLISCISVPITSIPLGSDDTYTFGVLGYCSNGVCSKPHVGYDPDAPMSGTTMTTPARMLARAILEKRAPTGFNLPLNARSTLTNILVVHYAAAGLTLVTLILSLIAHSRKPSHSARYLLCIFILSILSTILTLLSFLVDILTFMPHFGYGTWLVLAAFICNTLGMCKFIFKSVLG